MIETQEPLERPALDVGDRVKFAEQRVLWDVKAVSENFAALTQQVPFQPAGTLQYTVIDWKSGIRGPANLVGQGYGDGTYTHEECAEMLTEFEAHLTEDPAMVAALARGEKSWPSRPELEVSHRNRVTLDIERIDYADQDPAVLGEGR